MTVVWLLWFNLDGGVLATNDGFSRLKAAPTIPISNDCCCYCYFNNRYDLRKIFDSSFWCCLFRCDS